jgi:plastocyanin
MKDRILIGVLFVVVFAATGALAAADNTSAISGTVNVGAAKKFPTVVYVEEIPGFKAATPAKGVMDQKAKVFIPRVLPVVVGTTVEFLNSDPFEHNLFSPDGEKYDLGNWNKGEKRTYTFKRAGVYTQLCKLHPEMIAYVVVLKTPYFTIADDQGKFRIPNVPFGNVVVKVWNERFRPNQLQKSFAVTVTSGEEAKLDITP